MFPKALSRRIVGHGLAILTLAGSAGADDLQDTRKRGLTMARDIKAQIKSRYFDPTFRGMDLDAAFAKTETAIKGAASRAHVIAFLAQTLDELKDSHTILIPPMLSAQFDYGFETRVVGEECLVTSVSSESDAARKGLLPGDRLLSIEGTEPTRENLGTIWYVLGVIRPRGELKLVVQTGDAPPRAMVAATHVEQRRKTVDISQLFDELEERQHGKKAYAWRYWTYEKEQVVVLKLYSFMLTEDMINELMDKVNEAKALILDLRGNPGGSVDALQIAAGAFFKDEIEIGAQRLRKSTKPFRSRRPKSKRLFQGQLVVLVDSASQSSAEVLARVVQLEKRGTVVGDRTAGDVMVAEIVALNAGNEMMLVPYGLSVTTAALLMKDGASLEGKGVTPDEIVLPTGEDLRVGRDPAMSRAANLVGLNLTPSTAWSHFQPKVNPSPTPQRD